MNCFRSLYLWVDLQPHLLAFAYRLSCELLSFFVPLGWFTAAQLIQSETLSLWIAFVLCTFGLIYSRMWLRQKTAWVVNCFRSLYLWVDLQQTLVEPWDRDSCELLSFFVPLGWFTAKIAYWLFPFWLWIAFVLCTFGLIYSRWCHQAGGAELWIAFVLCTFGLIYSETPAAWCNGLLWIAFVLCTFGLIYSARDSHSVNGTVVNCFRSLYLWVDLQPAWILPKKKLRCELLSFFVPLGWFTAHPIQVLTTRTLWIAFVLCTFGLIYSNDASAPHVFSVVNCFRSLYLWVDLQRTRWSYPQNLCCELLSFFVPLGWFTAVCRAGVVAAELWIAFVLCTFGLIYSQTTGGTPKWEVVNCFRSLYLWVDLQLRMTPSRFKNSCELLSFFVPLGWFTASLFHSRATLLLWIAFVLCTFGLIYSVTSASSRPPSVVNCFRSLYLWVDLQLSRGGQHGVRGCELLSFFVPLGWFTAQAPSPRFSTWLWIAFVLCTFGLIYSVLLDIRRRGQLWIAFVLCTFGLIYSSMAIFCTRVSVVNCFRSLYLWVDLQPSPWLSAWPLVVNCFRSLYLWVDLQPSSSSATWWTGCELLSFFVPLGWFTAKAACRLESI